MAKSSPSSTTPAYAVSSKTPVLPTSNGPNQQPSLRVFRNLGSKQQQLQRNNNGIPARPGTNDTPSPSLVSSTLAADDNIMKPLDFTSKRVVSPTTSPYCTPENETRAHKRKSEPNSPHNGEGDSSNNGRLFFG